MTLYFGDSILEATQVDIGGYVLDIHIEPIGERFLVELRMPPKKRARAVEAQVMATTHVAFRRDVPEWIESVASVVWAKLNSAERAAMLRKGYA